MEIYKHLYANWTVKAFKGQHVILIKESVESEEDEMMFWFLSELRNLRLNVN